MARNTIVPYGRLAETVTALVAAGVKRDAIMFRRACARWDSDAEVKVASSPLYVQNVLNMQDRGERKPGHWSAVTWQEK